MAASLGAGFVPARKPGKLPWERVTESYELEYGADALEAHRDAMGRNQVLVVDDVLATGGTAAAAGQLGAGTGCRAGRVELPARDRAAGGTERLAERPPASSS